MEKSRLIARKIYSILPFKKQLYYFLKWFWTPPRSIFQHLHFKGNFNVNIEGRKLKLHHYGYQIENEIFWSGLDSGWEKVSIDIWKKLCKRSKVIMDLGANTGIFSLVAKTLNPAAAVFAFEPFHNAFTKLKANHELNGFKTVCIEAALSDYDGTATIYPHSLDHVLSVTVNKNLASPDQKVYEMEIRTMKLSTFIEQYKLTSIDLMKIDVETHESEVLSGMEKYLDQFRPAMLIEILNDEVGRNVENLVKDKGYLYYNIDENAGIKKVDHIYKSDYYNYLLCDRETAKYIGLET